MQKFSETIYLSFIAALLVAQISAYAVPDDSAIFEESASSETHQALKPLVHAEIINKTHNILIGEYHEIICEVRYIPKMSDIFWIRGDEIESAIENLRKQNPSMYIFSDDKKALSVVQSRYIIESTTEADAGKYSCVAFSEDKKHYVSSTVVNVQSGDVTEHEKSGPVITEMVTSMMSDIGSTITLLCRATRNAKITWIGTDDMPLENNEHYEINGGVLIIKSIVWEDMGSYTCLAETKNGTDSQMAFVYPINTFKQN